MEKMKELYEKVSGDSALQAKFTEIMKDAENAGKEETEKKLVAFAKEAGYEVTVDEMVSFFKKLETQQDGTLSEEELDAVAGGKASPGLLSVRGSGVVACGTPVLNSFPTTNCIRIIS